MSRIVYILAVVAACTVLAACSGYVRPDPFAPYVNRHNVYDLQFAWNTLPSPDAMEVRGVIKNVRYTAVDDLVLYLSLVDRENREVTRETFFPIPSLVPLDEWRTFQVILHHPPPAEGKLRFRYQYRAIEDEDTFNWMNLFDVDLASGAVVRN